jgi:hypothetical protein
MNEQDRSVRPETLALDELIKETIARVEASPDGDATDTMLFLGNRHQSFPTAVIKDPVLEPVDKLVWMVIMLAVRETGGNTAFPGYDAIAGMANVSSRSTTARAIAILRASRWLTLCGRMRKASGVTSMPCTMSLCPWPMSSIWMVTTWRFSTRPWVMAMPGYAPWPRGY